MLSLPPCSREQLTRDLFHLGVCRGDLLMVHASLRSLGPVEGGGGSVLACLQEAVGPQGTLLMLLGARNDWDWVNERPESEREGLLAQAVPFDARHTPAHPDMGYLADAFRQWPGTQVTDHPEARFGALGRLAGELLAEAPWHDAYGSGSPLERACRAGARVLRLGADLNTVTMLHQAEYLVDLPTKRRVRHHFRVRGPGGPEVRHVEGLDSTTGIVDWPGEDYFALILREYLDQGHARRARVGQAESELIDAAHLVTFATRWMAERFGPLQHG